MALTPQEQAALDALEADLASSDPRLAHTLRGTPTIVVDRRRALLGGAGLVAGLALLVAGISTHWVVSIVGFVVMLAGALVGLGSWHRLELAADDTVAVVTTPDDERLELWRRHHPLDED